MTSTAAEEPFEPSGETRPEPPEPVLRLVSDDVVDTALSDQQLGSRIVGLSGRIAAATCRWLLLVAEFDRREACAAFGLGNTARWLSHHCGIAHRTALDHVRVARALLTHEVLATEMGAGRISYSHARAISRVAEPEDSELVERLVDIAEHGTVGQLEDTVRGLRTVDRNERDDAERKAGRPVVPDDTVDSRFGSDSRWHLTARLAPERGALVDAALNAVVRAEGLDRVAALERLAEIGLAALADEGRMPRALRGDERAAIVIHLDAKDVPPRPDAPAGSGADAGAPTGAPGKGRSGKGRSERGRSGRDTTEKADGATGSGSATDSRSGAAPATGPRRPFARLVDGPGLPDSVAYRLLCDGRLRTVVYETDPDGRRRVLDVGRCQRLVTRKQYRALLARDGRRCVVPGCGSRRRLHVHHVVHWLHGGLTELDNEILVCEVHHLKIHDDEIRVESPAPGRFRFVLPDGRVLAEHVDPSSLAASAMPADHDHTEVAPDAAESRWDGTRLDRHYAISCLAQTRARLRGQRGTSAVPERRTREQRDVSSGIGDPPEAS